MRRICPFFAIPLRVMDMESQSPAPVTGPIPEVLPPVSPPQETARRPRPRWASAPATYLLVGINCAVFLAMVASGAGLMQPDSATLMRWGADQAGSVLVYGQWWRLGTAMFVHGGIIHLASNMWCLWNLGLLAEPLVGSMGVMLIYLLTGAAGNMLSILWSWFHPFHDQGGLYFPPGVGASGAVFGIAGALIILLKSNRLPVPPQELKRLRRSVIYFAVINLVIGGGINFGASFTGIYVDNWAHIGGFGSGLLMAAPMVPRVGFPRAQFDFRLRAATGMIVGLLALFAYYLTQLGR